MDICTVISLELKERHYFECCRSIYICVLTWTELESLLHPHFMIVEQLQCDQAYLTLSPLVLLAVIYIEPQDFFCSRKDYSGLNLRNIFHEMWSLKPSTDRR